MTKWALGTMGYSYEDWVGIIYPEGAKPANYLSHFAKYFNAVEMDTTFYGTPKESTVRRWKVITPPSFTFCPKTPRIITHNLSLVNASHLMDEFIDRMMLLEEKLGPILIQFPRSFTSESFGDLSRFLNNLPQITRYAIEFRNPSWETPPTHQLLREHQIGWASTDYEHMPRKVHRTTDFLYFRWIGKHGLFEKKDRVRIDRKSRLMWWLKQITPHLQKVDTVYGFFNNDYSGHSPATLNLFKSLIGLEVKEPNIPKQAVLF